MTAKSLLPVVGIARGTYHYQPDAMKRPDKGLRSTGARARGVRERQAQVRVQADPLGVEGHGNRGQREADHEALEPGTA